MDFTTYSAQILDQQRAANVTREAERRRVVAERQVLSETLAQGAAMTPAGKREIGWFGSLLRAAHLSHIPAAH